MKLAIRPRPELNESFQGYLLRLARVNGWHSTNDILRLFGCSLREYQRARAFEFNELLASLSAALDMPVDMLNDSFAWQFSHKCAYDEGRSIQDIGINHPRICSECISEGGIVNWYWGMLPINQCLRHGTKLIDTCPRCSHEFKWDSKLLEGCPSCDMKWMSDKHSFPVTEQQKTAWKILTDDQVIKLDSKAWLRDVCLAVLVASRPFDSNYRSVGSLPRLKNLTQLIDTAYDLLLTGERYQQWLANIGSIRKDIGFFSTQVIFYPWYYLRGKLSLEWPLKRLVIPSIHSAMEKELLPEHKMVIKPSRRKLAKHDEDMRFQASYAGVADILAIPSNQVLLLVEGKLLKPINQTNVLNDYLFDLRELENLFCKLRTVRPIKNSISISFDSELLKRNGTEYASIVSALYNHNLNGYLRPQSTGISRILLDEDDLKQWLERELKALCSEPVELKVACKILMCGKKKLFQLVKDGYFKLARISSVQDRVDGESFYRYKMNLQELCCDEKR